MAFSDLFFILEIDISTEKKREQVMGCYKTLRAIWRLIRLAMFIYRFTLAFELGAIVLPLRQQ